jgi:hypothetical protein
LERRRALAALDTSFDRCLADFESPRIFSGPSVYFYEELVRPIRSVPSLRDLASSDRLIELAYATLRSWGMHRMGERVATKLTEYPVFRDAVRALIKPAAALSNRRITELSEEDLGIVVGQPAVLVERSGISASGSPLVANAKMLHFLLPDLVPPIDRTYTGRFFYRAQQRHAASRRSPRRFGIRLPSVPLAGPETRGGDPVGRQLRLPGPGRGQRARQDGGGKSLTRQRGVGSSGRIRTGEDPPTPDDSDPLDPEINPTYFRRHFLRTG